MQVKTITAAELRMILFDVRDQEMTVGDLRRKLHDARDQDAEVAITRGMFAALGVQA